MYGIDKEISHLIGINYPEHLRNLYIFCIIIWDSYKIFFLY